jgi:ribonucleoside-diphosphate reductase alpha chain
MHVQTGTGIEPVDFNKILIKVATMASGLHTSVDASLVAQKTIERMVDGISTEELDNLSAGIAASLANIHPDYSILGARIAMDRLHKNLDIKNVSFSQNTEKLFNHYINGIKSIRIGQHSFDFIQKYKEKFDAMIDYSRDLEGYDFAAVQSFFKRGLEQIDGKVAETPQQMYMRVAIGLNVWKPRSAREKQLFEEQTGVKLTPSHIEKMNDEERLVEIERYYNLLSARKISHSGPVLMHAGSEYNQMASCYLQYVEDALTGDEYHETGMVGGIMKAMTQLAKQSQGGGGNAITITDLRASGSPIRKTNGKSNGLLPFMKMFDATIGAINQSGKRAGTCAVYLEPWHADILDYLDAGNHFTIEEKRCKNIFYGLLMNDVFFERLMKDQGQAQWTLFDPGMVANHLEKPLSEYYGDEFKAKYEELEALGVGRTIPLMEIWTRCCNLWQTTGMPYILNKDEINKKSNQKNIGVVKQSNLCTEITLVSNPGETAVCVLGSVCISQFYNAKIEGKVDYDGIIETARLATRTLNNVIDLQYYPTPETRNSCLMRRAIGIGAQGLADLFHELRIGFTSDEAKAVNKKVYEAIYYGCLKESMELAKQDGSYTGFDGSPASKGKLQFDMWGVGESDLMMQKEWAQLKKDIQKYGLRNSEVTALAPTASSSIRMGNNEMHEPYTRNVYVRQTIAGSMQIVNKHLVQELVELDLWNQAICDAIIMQDGSVQGIDLIPQEIQDRYQTVYELDWMKLIDMMAERSPFVSQTSSYNHYTTYENSGPTAFTQKVIYAWKKGLKTISYYQHTEAASTGRKELGMDMPATASDQNKEMASVAFGGGINIEPKKSAWNPEAALVDDGIEVMAVGEVCEDCST